MSSRQEYSDRLNELDACIFTGLMLELNLDEVQEYLGRWDREVKRYKRIISKAEGKVLIEITNSQGLKTISLHPCSQCHIGSEIVHEVRRSGYFIKCQKCRTSAAGTSWEEAAKVWNTMWGTK